MSHAGQDYTRLRDFRNIGKELDDSTFISGRTYFIKNGTDINGDVWDWELAKDKKFKVRFPLGKLPKQEILFI